MLNFQLHNLITKFENFAKLKTSLFISPSQKKKKKFRFLVTKTIKLFLIFVTLLTQF